MDFFFKPLLFFVVPEFISIFLTSLGLGVVFSPRVRFHQELAPLSAELDEEELRAIRKALESGGKG